ncbi:hypothetical protein F6V25_00625 [Oryzomonas japonica]|uniref:Uncharacterized protein n=1 Tax=Oryzomonas japonica TaxID=2603858 RepID=A0A7J4ZUE4_9BACT|nr:hypothetical protein [Oryzomonas japonica]KAB0667238.1 hypothetical protein F6V25_00625 [Oryzomonas japonica]
MKKQELINLAWAIVFILAGILMISLNEGGGAYSYKQHMHVLYPSSSIKEIFGTSCILLGIFFCFLIYRGHQNQKGANKVTGTKL